MYRFKALWISAGVAGLLAGAAFAQEAEFGSERDVSFSQTVWSAMEEAGLAGEDATHVRAYEGQEPHGAVLETLRTNLELEGSGAQFIIKRNYVGDGVSPAAVWDDPEAYFDSITVMVEQPQAESGWFWAKFTPEGSLTTTPQNVQMAGQVAGCIACHGDAEGADMIFAND